MRKPGEVYAIGGTNMKRGWQRETIRKGLAKLTFDQASYPYDASGRYFRNKTKTDFYKSFWCNYVNNVLLQTN